MYNIIMLKIGRQTAFVTVSMVQSLRHVDCYVFVNFPIYNLMQEGHDTLVGGSTWYSRAEQMAAQQITLDKEDVHVAVSGSLYARPWKPAGADANIT